MSRVVLKIASVVSVCLAVVGVFCYYAFRPSDYVSEDGLIIENVSDDCVVDTFVKSKIAKSPFVVEMCLKIFRLKKMHVVFGEYKIPDNASVVDALNIVTSGDVMIRKVYIPEGFSVVQTMKRLNDNKHLLGEITEIPEEGSMFPDVYTFKYPTTRDEIIRISQNAMKKYVRENWDKRSPECFLKTPEEAIILASIVTKEHTRHDVREIAGVYFNRLKKGMRLQSDPTTIYAITGGKKLGRALLFSDLQNMSPYNTYRHKGLPPTAIANPDRLALDSVLHPAKHDYLFFQHDANRQIYLAKTFEEHKRNAKKMREGVRNLKYTKD